MAFSSNASIGGGNSVQRADEFYPERRTLYRKPQSGTQPFCSNLNIMFESAKLFIS